MEKVGRAHAQLTLFRVAILYSLVNSSAMRVYPLLKVPDREAIKAVSTTQGRKTTLKTVWLHFFPFSGSKINLIYRKKGGLFLHRP